MFDSTRRSKPDARLVGLNHTLERRDVKIIFEYNREEIPSIRKPMPNPGALLFTRPADVNTVALFAHALAPTYRPRS